jgi:hypothetical protein
MSEAGSTDATSGTGRSTVHPTAGPLASWVRVAAPVLVAMSDEQREEVVTALAELLAADLDHPTRPSSDPDPAD